ncbi:AraC family transcriptional regulator [Paenibacillus dokdonensis]|uniref:AraC family transcriptional regulator n=1 Tax=Paenibacillus dokdonensis TaxID=2567944 RepID=UPI0010A8C98D|nr:AraC family transcriptional regulator [Paenibacillus dokdonensis]
MIKIQSVRQDNGLNGNEEKWNTEEAGFSFGIVTYGKCVYWINDQRIIMEKGDAILIPSKSPFYWKSVPTVFHSKYVINFNVTTDSPELPLLGSEKTLHSKLGCFDLVHERLKLLIHQWTDKHSYYDLYTNVLLTEILILWNRELDRGTILSKKYKHVELMKRYIQDHYRTKITKHDLADVVNRSPNHAATLFKSVTGQTISEYVHALRIKTGVYMLTESQLTVGEISDFLGYSDVSFFNKKFKGNTGRNPSDYLTDRPRIV